MRRCCFECMYGLYNTLWDSKMTANCTGNRQSWPVLASIRVFYYRAARSAAGIRTGYASIKSLDGLSPMWRNRYFYYMDVVYWKYDIETAFLCHSRLWKKGHDSRPWGTQITVGIIYRHWVVDTEVLWVFPLSNRIIDKENHLYIYTHIIHRNYRRGWEKYKMYLI
jgi:hypothetical protein